MPNADISAQFSLFDVWYCNRFRDSFPIKLGQNNDGNQISQQLIDTDDFWLLTAIIAHFWKTHVWGQWNVYIVA